MVDEGVSLGVQRGEAEGAAIVVRAVPVQEKFLAVGIEDVTFVDRRVIQRLTLAQGCRPWLCVDGVDLVDPDGCDVMLAIAPEAWSTGATGEMCMGVVLEGENGVTDLQIEGILTDVQIPVRRRVRVLQNLGPVLVQRGEADPDVAVVLGGVPAYLVVVGGLDGVALFQVRAYAVLHQVEAGGRQHLRRDRARHGKAVDAHLGGHVLIGLTAEQRGFQHEAVVVVRHAQGHGVAAVYLVLRAVRQFVDVDGLGHGLAVGTQDGHLVGIQRHHGEEASVVELAVPVQLAHVPGGNDRLFRLGLGAVGACARNDHGAGRCAALGLVAQGERRLRFGLAGLVDRIDFRDHQVGRTVCGIGAQQPVLDVRNAGKWVCPVPGRVHGRALAGIGGRHR